MCSRAPHSSRPSLLQNSQFCRSSVVLLGGGAGPATPGKCPLRVGATPVPPGLISSATSDRGGITRSSARGSTEGPTAKEKIGREGINPSPTAFRDGMNPRGRRLPCSLSPPCSPCPILTAGRRGHPPRRCREASAQTSAPRCRHWAPRQGKPRRAATSAMRCTRSPAGVPGLRLPVTEPGTRTAVAASRRVRSATSRTSSISVSVPPPVSRQRHFGSGDIRSERRPRRRGLPVPVPRPSGRSTCPPATRTPVRSKPS